MRQELNLSPPLFKGISPPTTLCWCGWGRYCSPFLLFCTFFPGSPPAHFKHLALLASLWPRRKAFSFFLHLFFFTCLKGPKGVDLSFYDRDWAFKPDCPSVPPFKFSWPDLPGNPPVTLFFTFPSLLSITLACLPPLTIFQPWRNVLKQFLSLCWRHQVCFWAPFLRPYNALFLSATHPFDFDFTVLLPSSAPGIRVYPSWFPTFFVSLVPYSGVIVFLKTCVFFLFTVLLWLAFAQSALMFLTVRLLTSLFQVPSFSSFLSFFPKTSKLVFPLGLWGRSSVFLHCLARQFQHCYAFLFDCPPKVVPYPWASLWHAIPRLPLLIFTFHTIILLVPFFGSPVLNSHAVLFLPFCYKALVPPVLKSI